MDLRTVLAAHGARRVTLVGAGLGGQVALEAARESGRVERLVLLGTSPRGDGVDLSAVRASRTDESTLRTSMTDLLSASFRASHPDVVDRIVAWRSAEDADASAWAAMADVVRDYSASACYEVTQPTLVVHGTGDRVWPVESGRELADSLPRGRFVPVEDAGHLVGVEASRVVNDELIAFLPELS